MPLNLIHGPLNSGRIGRVLARFADALERDPILVVPNMDEVFRIERELCKDRAVLGGSVMTFGELFKTVAALRDVPTTPELSSTQRLRAIAVAVAECRERLGPLRRSSEHAGFTIALKRLFDELQAAGLDPANVRAGAESLEGSAYLNDLATLFAAYEEVRSRLGRVDDHCIARDAIRLIVEEGGSLGRRPVFVYGLDDLTRNQFELLRALSTVTEVTVALPLEDRDVLATHSALATRLREEIDIADWTPTAPVPTNTPNPLLFHLERSFGVTDAAARPPGEGLVLLRSAGARGEAEAIAAKVGQLLHDGAKAEEVAIVLRDPVRRGPLLARALESYGIAPALEAELPVSSTGVGGALLALLETEYGTGRATDVLRWLRGPSGIDPSKTDWLERSIRRNRVQTAEEALRLWLERNERLPYDLRKLRDVDPTRLTVEVGRAAKRMVARFLGKREDGPPPSPGDGTELRAAAAIAAAMAELSELDDLAPDPGELIGLLGDLHFRAWSGPVEGRVRIADPRRLRAGRFAHVVIGSLQDGEFPRRGNGDPFLSSAQRESLGMDPRQDEEIEERYLFYTSLSLAKRSLILSYRDSDEVGAAVAARSPFLDEIRRLLDPPPPLDGVDPVEEAITEGRGLADLVYPATTAPSEDELARSVAVCSEASDTQGLLDAAGAPPATCERVAARVAAAQRAEEATRKPGPLGNPAVIEALRAVPAYGGTTLEGFDVCSYRWFVGHELRPRPLDPTPDPLLQGSLMHEALYRLYREKPGGDPCPRPSSLTTWVGRGRELVMELARERELGEHPAERAIRRSVEGLLARFLAEEAKREGAAFEPWLLEARFGADEESERPPLEINGWLLHGAIDRVDRAPDGRALIHDYKVASRAPAARKLEEEAKLQLQLYLMAVKRWGAKPAGALYHPLRATKDRRPRGLVPDDAADDLAAYNLVGTDVLTVEEFDGLLEEALERASGIVGRMRDGDIGRDPGPRAGLRGHDVCPSHCDFAPICRRDRSPLADEESEAEER